MLPNLMTVGPQELAKAQMAHELHCTTEEEVRGCVGMCIGVWGCVVCRGCVVCVGDVWWYLGDAWCV